MRILANNYKRFREGIKTYGKVLGKRRELCDKHSKMWQEGDKFERFGGKACEKCVIATVK